MMNEKNPSPLERLATDPVVPPADTDSEPTDSNPVPLSPTDPKHREASGEQARDGEPGVVPVVPAAGLSGSGMPGAVGAVPAAGAIPAARALGALPDSSDDEDTGTKSDGSD